MENAQAARLIEKKNDLIRDFLAGKPVNVLSSLTGHLDEYFYSLFEKSIAARKMVVSGNPFALIALGGYGRREQSVGSDVDILFLQGGRSTGELIIPHERMSRRRFVLLPLSEVWHHVVPGLEKTPGELLRLLNDDSPIIFRCRLKED